MNVELHTKTLVAPKVLGPAAPERHENGAELGIGLAFRRVLAPRSLTSIQLRSLPTTGG
jgi:hypothetical protein